MNRLGLETRDLQSLVRLARANPYLRIEGLMSHFSCAEKPDAPLTRRQLKEFRQTLTLLSGACHPIEFVHMENSAGLQHGLVPEANVARVGAQLFGMENKELTPVARWTAQIYQTRDIAKDAFVGYGPRFKAKRALRMAVLGVGYGDGYPRILSNRASVLIRGQRCPVIGSISMDLTAVDISRCPDVNPKRDRAVLLGRDGDSTILAEELATYAETISWEITTRISPRVPRVFV